MTRAQLQPMWNDPFPILARRSRYGILISLGSFSSKEHATGGKHEATGTVPLKAILQGNDSQKS